MSRRDAYKTLCEVEGKSGRPLVRAFRKVAACGVKQAGECRPQALLSFKWQFVLVILLGLGFSWLAQDRQL